MAKTADWFSRTNLRMMIAHGRAIIIPPQNITSISFFRFPGFFLIVRLFQTGSLPAEEQVLLK